MVASSIYSYNYYYWYHCTSFAVALNDYWYWERSFNCLWGINEERNYLCAFVFRMIICLFIASKIIRFHSASLQWSWHLKTITSVICEKGILKCMSTFRKCLSYIRITLQASWCCSFKCSTCDCRKKWHILSQFDKKFVELIVLYVEPKSVVWQMFTFKAYLGGTRRNNIYMKRSRYMKSNVCLY